jgi:hypothetical protein
LKISIFNFSKRPKRGDFGRTKKECLRQNVMLAAKMPLFPLNLNALKIEKEMAIQIPALTRKTRGQGGILILEEKKKKSLLAFFKNINAK